MVSQFSDFMFTGKRILSLAEMRVIDLCYTPENVLLKFDGNSIELDSAESEIVRRWADLGLQIATVDNEELLLRGRCEFQETLRRARSLNRTASRVRKPRKPARAVVDIEVWKSSNSPAAPATAPAA